MKTNQFIYVVKFGDEYINSFTDLEKCIKFAKSLSKNMKEQGHYDDYYSIYYNNIEIAQF